MRGVARDFEVALCDVKVLEAEQPIVAGKLGGFLAVLEDLGRA
jgi:hypothetical protein